MIDLAKIASSIATIGASATGVFNVATTALTVGLRLFTIGEQAWTAIHAVLVQHGEQETAALVGQARSLFAKVTANAEGDLAALDAAHPELAQEAKEVSR